MNILDIGIKLNNDHFGSRESWEQINQVLADLGNSLGLEEVSAGTGMGIRDMQWVIPPDKDPDSVQLRAEKFLQDRRVAWDYCSWYEQKESDV